MAVDPADGIDFDEWRRLAAEDPAAFEARRKAAIGKLIGDAPHHLQPRLHALQWRVDQTRRRSKTPLAACINISRMMWNSVLGSHGFLESLNGRREPLPRAKVLNMRRIEKAR